MHVLECAWHAAGTPVIPGSTTDPVIGSCARCGQRAQLTPTRHVVSKVFTAFDTWVSPSGAGLCPICTWGYTRSELRTHPFLIGQDQTMVRLSRLSLVDLLTAGPLSGSLAVVIPLRPGRKHLMPDASWGRLTLDDIQLPWSRTAAGRLAATVRLRGYGFGSRMLAQPAPPWSVLHRLPAAEWAAVLDDWSRLDPWRPHSPWLDVALYATLQETR